MKQPPRKYTPRPLPPEGERRCPECGRPLQPAPAHWDGEATTVGYLPCPRCQPAISKEVEI